MAVQRSRATFGCQGGNLSTGQWLLGTEGSHVTVCGENDENVCFVF